jgi:GH18 family chitinase
MVSYDNACSFGMSNRYCPPFVELTYKIVAKGKYIKSTGLAGFSMWEASGDSLDSLLNAINSAIGNTY